MAVFDKKSVLVLGGSRGIGAAIVRRFVADGANVTFTYSGPQAVAEELAAMVAWLAGAEASFLTGAMHTIDGAFGA